MTTREEFLAGASLCDLADRIRKRETCSAELVQIYLDRIGRYGGRDGVNAYITLAGEAALKRAEKLDRLAREGRLAGPLHGLPIAVKDNLNTRSMRTTGGSRILSGWTPPDNASVVERLERAGAVILGKTNMHEFAFGVTSNNPFYGPVRNPYDLCRIAGGSSGGSAAAVAAGLCAAAVGTDTAGSVRIPASLCNVVGLKPTIGRVGRGGVMQLSFSRDVVGPLTRTVPDAAMLMNVMAGWDHRDPESSRANIPNYLNCREGNLKGKRFGVPRTYFFDGIHSDTRTVIEAAIERFEKLGARVRELEVRHMEIAAQTSFNITMSECVYLMEAYLRTWNPHATLDRYLDQMGPDLRIVLGRQIGAPGSNPVPGYAYARSAREDRNRMISAFAEAMDGTDALLLPTTPLPAAPIGEDWKTDLEGVEVKTYLTYVKACDPISLIGYPAISVPAGCSRTGLPIGLQIVAKPFQEEELLRIACCFERGRG